MDPPPQCLWRDKLRIYTNKRPQKLVWWGEAPEQRYDFDEGAGLYSPKIWLHQYARRAVVYRVNEV